MSHKKHNLLLVEFAALDRFHRAIEFPYIQGYLRDRGIHTRWLRYGVRAAKALDRSDNGVILDEGELERLVDTVQREKPEAILFSRAPTATVLDSLHRTNPTTELRQLGESRAPRLVSVQAPEQALFEFACISVRAHRSSPHRTLVREELDRGRKPKRQGKSDNVLHCGDTPERTPRLEGFDILNGLPNSWKELTAPERDQYSDIHGRLFEAVPDFEFEAANEPARDMQPLPFLVLGRECFYNKPLSSNPLFADLDLSTARRPGGCSFCSRPAETQRPKPFSLEGTRKQLIALYRTHPRDHRRLAVRLVGEVALRNIDRIADLLLELELPPTDWLIDGRTDVLLRQESKLAAAAEKMSSKRHRLQLCLVGLESFSVAELQRFNKGISPLDHLALLRMLLRLEEAHPDSFDFREQGGFSMILFTPWTTLDDLATTLLLVEACGLESLTGKLLSSRLRLEPELPITRLARRDGLLIERYDDALLDTASRNLYDTELPWRFADPALEAVCRVFIRIRRESTLALDSLSSRVDAILETVEERGWTPLGFALSLVSLARERVWENAEALLDAFEAQLSERISASRASNAETYQGPDQLEPSRFVRHVRPLVELTRQGIKPVSKIEPVTREIAAQLIEQLELPNAIVRKRADARASTAFELYFGEDRRKVERVVELTKLTVLNDDRAMVLEANLEIGELLGYPRCCVEAFAGQTTRERESYSWLHLERRLASSGPVSHTLNPWANLLGGHHVPCSLECSATLSALQRAREVLEAWDSDWVASIDVQSRDPWLVKLDSQVNALRLVPEGRVGDRFRFRADRTLVVDRDLQRAYDGDNIIIDESTIHVLRRGRLIADLSMRAFVWWHERQFQSALWTDVLAIRSHSAALELREPNSYEAVKPFKRSLEAAIDDALAHGLDLGPGEKVTLSIESSDRLLLTLGGDRLRLFVHPLHSDHRSLFAVGPFAFSLPGQDGTLTPEGRQIAVRLVRHLRRWLEGRP